MYAVAGILIAVAVVCTVVPLLMQYASQTSMSVSASSVEQQVRLWPESRIDDELRAARAYNRDLVRSGQPVLGAQADPFSNGERLSSQSAQDQRYGRLLNEGHGIMGRVSIPKISVDLPIYHGTGDKQLSLGSGPSVWHEPAGRRQQHPCGHYRPSRHGAGADVHQIG